MIAGKDGERTVGMDEFHIGPYMTAIQDAEILTEIRVPVRPGAGSAHEKVERRAGDWAIVAVSAALWMDGGTISDAGVALSAVGPTTIHATRSEEALRGKQPSEELFAEAGKLASEDCYPSADGRGPVDYKRHLAGVLTKRALRRAAERALEPGGLNGESPSRSTARSHARTSSPPCCWSTSCATRSASRARTGAATRPTAAPASSTSTGAR